MRFRALKLGLSVAGLALAVVAIAINDTRLTWGAIAVLAVAVALRFIGGRPS
jgi:hypothetical protein